MLKRLDDGERKLLAQYLKYDADAIDFCETVILCAHFWDDLIDRDVTHEPNEINHVMWKLWIELPRNPFYRRYLDQLSPVMAIAASDWMTATQWEHEKDACLEKRAVSYGIRSSYLNVLVMAAMIVGGSEYGIATAPWLREQFHVETLRNYINEINRSNKET